MNADKGSRRSFDSGQRESYYPAPPPPQRSYVIFDGDVSALPNARERPLEGSTKPWHVEFNQRRLGQASQLIPATLAYQSVFSNLIQVYDEPSQRKYYGPYDGKAYLEPERGYQNYPRLTARPLDVPKYEVVYPLKNHRNHHYYSNQLPQKFPVPFYPNKNFEFKDPPPVDGPRRNFELFRTQTINYPPREIPQDQRESRRGQCNYIQLNEKGFPVGNEMCSRSINDILLAPDYATTGDLVLEHRKRYRGVEKNFETNEVKRDAGFRRNRRSAEDLSSRFGGGYSSYYSNGGCCGEVVGSAGYGGYGGYGGPYYGYRNDGPEYDYDNVRFMSRPYESERGSYGGYGYRDGGQYGGNNGDDVGEETSDNRGLASYLTNRGRGDRGRFRDSTEAEGDEESRESGSSNSSGNSNSNSNGRNNSESRGNDRAGNSQGRKSNNSGRNNNRRNQSSNRNSNSDRDSESNSNNQSHGNNKSYSSNRRNLGSSSRDSDEGYSYGSNNGGRNGGSSSDGYYSRNGGNNYGYLRNYDNNMNSGRNYGSNGYYGGMSNLGSSSFGSYGDMASNYGRGGGGSLYG